MKIPNLSIPAIVISILACIGVLMAGCPQYNCYREEMAGKAKLNHAKYFKEVAVAEAKAKMESAAYEAMADTTRAHGVARSNEIIGQSLNRNEAYLKWLWLSELSKQQNVIYVSTGLDNLPILEANRLDHLKGKDSLEAEGTR